MKILIADDHAIVRSGLRQIVSTLRPDWPPAREAADADQALEALRGEKFDVVILDVSLGSRGGLDILPQIRAVQPPPPVLMLSMHSEEQYALRALRAGASGYIQKDRSPEEIIAAIEHVGTGHAYMSAVVADQMAAELTRRAADRPHERLSQREFEVFRQLAFGKSVSQISEGMSLSVKTVSTYRTRILMKTGFKTNADVIRYAIENGIV